MTIPAGRLLWRSTSWTGGSSCCSRGSRGSAYWRCPGGSEWRAGRLQARLDRLQSNGVIRGFGPQVDPAALGYPVTAFATLQIRQGQGPDVRAHLASVPEVLELHTTTGSGDMLCRLVARSNADLQRVIDRVVGFDGIDRAATAIVMENPVPLRIIPLVEQAASEHGD